MFEPSHMSSEYSGDYTRILQPTLSYSRSLTVLSGEDLETYQFEPRVSLLHPWLPKDGLAMVYAPRGVGKTWFAMNVAYAVASGGSYLGWQAPIPRRVVYIDGEMPAAELQSRYNAIVSTSQSKPDREAFSLLSSALQRDGLPDLSKLETQQFYEPYIEACDLIVVDNISTVAFGLKENDADAWTPVQIWALQQRARGRSVLFVHHAGKSGGQRGTSRKEDILDTVINLKRPLAHSGSEGACFEVHFEKNRGFYGAETEPFQARLKDGLWEKGEIDFGENDERVFNLIDSGLSVREVAEKTGYSKSTVARLNQARRAGR